ncbi:MAG: hypothetical protein FJZ01_05115 [Candidatus Sericytochromatia bacterium]|nr:hypothetical protein [Candidatus Tanganyikabacteria bacterium]
MGTRVTGPLAQPVGNPGFNRGAAGPGPAAAAPGTRPPGARGTTRLGSDSLMLAGGGAGPSALRPGNRSQAADLFRQRHGAALQRLDPPRQEALDKVLGAYGDPANAGRFGHLADKLPGRTYQDLGKLLENGTLSKPDRYGRTMVETLAARVEQPLHESLRGKVDPLYAISDLVAVTAHPETVYQGQGTRTCAAATIQSTFAQAAPADFARFSTDLLFDGSAAGLGGGQIKLSARELLDREEGKDTGRGPFNALVQGSLSDFARETVPDDAEPADNRNTFAELAGLAGSDYEGGRLGGGRSYGGGRLGARRTFGGGRLGGSRQYGGVDDPGGLTEAQIQGLAGKVLGIGTHIVSPGEFQGLAGAISSAYEMDASRSRGPLSFLLPRDTKAAGQVGMAAKTAVLGRIAQSRSVMAGVQTPEGTFHQVRVLGEQGGKIRYFDPGTGRIDAISAREFWERAQTFIVQHR